MAKKTAKKMTRKATAKKAARKSAPKAKPKAARAAGKSAKTRATKRASGLDLAAKVLADSKEPLNAMDITERVIAAGWKTSGKTPHATLYAAIVREITKKGEDARFVKRDRGLFTARKGV